MANQPLTFKRSLEDRRSKVTSKRISGEVIVGRFCNCLGLPQTIDGKRPLSKLLGGGLQKWDLGLMLMSCSFFKADGLILHKQDVEKCKTVSDLGNLVFAWYRADGWTIVK